jgi:hypothetical protein
MQINLISDSSVSAAPPGFLTAIEEAAQFLDNLITNPITVNILVGWGEDDNGAYSIGNSLSLGAALGQTFTYSQVKNALLGSGTAADEFAAANLPSTGQSFFVGGAEAQALGLLPASGSQIDGAIGFNSNEPWNYSNQPVSGKFDLVTDAELELVHALGLQLGSPMMLFRYSAPGVLETAVNSDGTTPAAYFSLDGGNTNLDNYLTTGDSTLWNTTTTGNDVLANPYSPNVGYIFSITDATELNALGFGVNTAALENNGIIYGTTAHETVYAFELPNNAVYSGSGSDTIVFSADRSDYTIVTNSDQSISVTNGVSSYKLYGVSELQFPNQTLTTAGIAASQDTSGITSAVIAEMTGASPSTATLTNLENNPDIIPAYVSFATTNGLNIGLVVAEDIGLAYCGSSSFESAYGGLSLSAFSTQASALTGISATFIDQQTQYFINLYTANGLPGIPTPTAAQIQGAAYGVVFGLAVGLAVEGVGSQVSSVSSLASASHSAEGVGSQVSSVSSVASASHSAGTLVPSKVPAHVETVGSTEALHEIGLVGVYHEGPVSTPHLAY